MKINKTAVPKIDLVLSSVNTINSSWLKLWIVKIFGQKIIVGDMYGDFELRKWRGVHYLIKRYPSPPRHYNCRCIIEVELDEK